MTRGDCVLKGRQRLRQEGLGGGAEGEMIGLESLEGEQSKSENML